MKLIARVASQTVPLEISRNSDTFTIVISGRRYTVDARALGAGVYALRIDNRVYEAVVLRQGESRTVHLDGEIFSVELEDPRQYKDQRTAQRNASGPHAIKTQMPGKVVRVLVAVGDAVAENQGLLVLEAMKMQNEIKAPKAGRIRQVAVEPNKAVNAGDLLIVIE